MVYSAVNLVVVQWPWPCDPASSQDCLIGVNKADIYRVTELIITAARICWPCSASGTTNHLWKM